MIKKSLIYWIVAFVALVIQGSLLPVFFKSGQIPSLIFMLILAWSLIDGFERFFWWTILFGIMTDLAGTSALGTHVIAFSLLTYAVTFLSRRFSGDIRGGGTLLAILFVTIGTLIAKAVAIPMLSFSDDFPSVVFSVYAHPVEIMLSVFYNSILFFIISFFIPRLKKFFTIE